MTKKHFAHGASDRNFQMSLCRETGLVEKTTYVKFLQNVKTTMPGCIHTASVVGADVLRGNEVLRLTSAYGAEFAIARESGQAMAGKQVQPDRIFCLTI